LPILEASCDGSTFAVDFAHPLAAATASKAATMIPRPNAAAYLFAEAVMIPPICDSSAYRHDMHAAILSRARL
jgi:hypothetical protein